MGDLNDVLEELGVNFYKMEISCPINLQHFEEIAACYRQKMRNLLLSRQETIQQLKTGQLENLKSQEEELKKKKDGLDKKKTDLQINLKKAEYLQSDIATKLDVEEKLHAELINVVAKLKTEKEEKNSIFQKQWKSCLTIMGWYKKYLGIHIKLSESRELNPNIRSVTVYFGQNLDTFDENAPHVEFEVSPECNVWHLVKIQPYVKYRGNFKMTDGFQVTDFIYQIRRIFQQNKINC